MAIELREYQSSAVSSIRETMSRGSRRVVLHAPCGAGKTVTCIDIISKAVSKGSNVLFLANRRELVFQAKRTIEDFGLTCGVIMAGEDPCFEEKIQVASMQTYQRRMDLEELRFNQWWHDAKLIVVDECHGSISPTYQKILKSYSDDVYTLGLSATPARADGRGLGEFYDDIVSTIDVSGLIDQNYLVPVRYFTPSTPDLAGIKTVAGDYDKKELGKRVNTAKLVGDIYDNWSVICPDRPTIIFATNVKHSIAIEEQFKRNGVSIAHIDAKTPAEIRENALNMLRTGRLQVITNVGILCEGFDFPEASCIVLARPTKSLGLYIQMAGRGLRTADLKYNCVLLDHGGCVEEHGLLEWSREWSLDGKKKAWSKVKKKEKEETMLKCSACHLVFAGSTKCPDCGSEPKRFGKKVEVIDAELQELKANKKDSIDAKRMYLGMLKHWVREKGYSPKMINAKYKTRYDCWVHHSIKDVAPIEPDTAFLNLMKHDMIKWAKRKK